MLQHKITRQRGLSIVELMISMLIGMFLLLGIIQFFLANKQTYRMQDQLAQMQEDGRFALDAIEAQIRMTNYSGCYDDLSVGVENRLKTNVLAWDLSRTLDGYNDVAYGDDIGGITGFVANTDVLVIKGMAASVPLNGDSDDDQLTVNTAANSLEQGDILIVTDCEQATLFQSTGVAVDGSDSTITVITHTGSSTFAPGNSIATVSNHYSLDAEIGRLETVVYYIKNGSSNTPSLFQASLGVSGGNTVSLVEDELIQNVENMQIVYGEDTDDDGDVNTYRDADSVVDWHNIVSVRMTLLLTSEPDYESTSMTALAFDSASFTYDECKWEYGGQAIGNAAGCPGSESGYDTRLKREVKLFSMLRNRNS